MRVRAHYLVYKLLHLLHGVVSLQQRRHSHETFIAATVILFLLLFFPVIVVVFSPVLRDVLTRQEKQTRLGRRGSGGLICTEQRVTAYEINEVQWTTVGM